MQRIASCGQYQPDTSLASIGDGLGLAPNNRYGVAFLSLREEPPLGERNPQVEDGDTSYNGHPLG
jgi:hypothetical protein